MINKKLLGEAIKKYREAKLLPNFKLNEILEILEICAKECSSNDYLEKIAGLVGKIYKFSVFHKKSDVYGEISLYLEAIAVLSATIYRNYPAFSQKHRGIDWKRLGDLDAFLDMYSSPAYQNFPELIIYMLNHSEVLVELRNLAEAIHRIRSIAFYQQEQEITSHLSETISFVMASIRLYTLHKEILQAEFEYFKYHWEKNDGSLGYQTPFRIMPAPHLNFAKLYPAPSETNSRLSGMTLPHEQANESIGKIHCVLTLARVGEAFLNLPSILQEFLPYPGIVEELKKLRNQIFHPEREENWQIIKNLLYTIDQNVLLLIQNLIDHIDEILLNYIVVREIYDLYAGRKWQLEESTEVNQIIMKNKLKIRSLISQKISCDEYEHYRSGVSITIEELWNILTSKCAKGFELGEILDEKSLQKKARSLLQFNGDIKDDDYDILELYVRSHSRKYVNTVHSLSKEYEKLEEDFRLVSYKKSLHNSLKHRDNILDLFNILKNLKNVPKPEIIKKKTMKFSEFTKHYDESSRALIRYNDNDGKLLYSKRMILYDELLKSYKNIIKYFAKLEDFYDYYFASSYVSRHFSDYSQHDFLYYEENILIDYASLIHKFDHEFSIARQLMNDIFAIDVELQNQTKPTEIANILPLLQHLLFCFEKIQHYYRLTENPGITAVFFNEVGPTYSTVEFFAMIAGSLIRACFDQSELFVQEARKIPIHLPKKLESTDLYKLLSKIQEWRGKIAHVEAEAPENGNQQFYYEAFSVGGLNGKYNDYASVCKPLIQKFMTYLNDYKDPFALDAISSITQADDLEMWPLVLFNQQPIVSSKIYMEITPTLEVDELRTSITYEMQAAYPDQEIIEILPILPDGNCMYNTIIQGIRRLPLGYNGNREITLAELRKKVAEKIKNAPKEATGNNDSFQDYVEVLELQLQANVIDQDFAGFSGRILDNLMSLRGLSDEAVLSGIRERSIVSQYIEMIEQNQAWGGNVELGIMSRILDVQFIIHRRGAAASHIENHTGREDAYAIHMDYTGDHYNLILSNIPLFIENNTLQERPMQSFNDMYLEQNALHLEFKEYPFYSDDIENSSTLMILMGLILLMHKCDDIYF